MSVLDEALVKILNRLNSIDERVKNLERQEIPLGFGAARMWVGLVAVTTAPAITITEIYDGLGITVAGSSLGSGAWNLTASSAVFTANQTIAFGGLVQSTTGQIASLSYVSTTVIRLTTFSAAATPADQNLSGIPVVVMVW
jgi:hypothetical protein